MAEENKISIPVHEVTSSGSSSTGSGGTDWGGIISIAGNIAGNLYKNNQEKQQETVQPESKKATTIKSLPPYFQDVIFDVSSNMQGTLKAKPLGEAIASTYGYNKPLDLLLNGTGNKWLDDLIDNSGIRESARQLTKKEPPDLNKFESNALVQTFDDIVKSSDVIDREFHGENFESLVNKALGADGFANEMSDLSGGGAVGLSMGMQASSQAWGRVTNFMTHNIVRGMASNAMPIVASLAGRPDISIALIAQSGVSAAGQKYYELRKNAPDMPEEQRIQNAVMTGALQFILQKVALNLTAVGAKIVAKAGINIGSAILKNSITQSLQQGMGEALAKAAGLEIAGNVLNGMVNYTFQTLLDNIYNYNVKSWKEFVYGLTEIGIISAAHALIIQSPATVMRGYSEAMSIYKATGNPAMLPNENEILLNGAMLDNYGNGFKDQPSNVISGDHARASQMLEDMYKGGIFSEDVRAMENVNKLVEDTKLKLESKEGFARIGSDTPKEIKVNLQEGEKVRGLSKSIQESLETDLGELPTYKTRNMSEVAKRVEALINENPELAKKIAMGEAEEVSNIRAQEVFTGLRIKAIKENNIELIKELALSEYATSMATELGQRIKALDTMEDIDPVRHIREVVEERKKAVEEGKVKTSEVPEKEIESLKQRLSKAESDLEKYKKGVTKKSSFGAKNKIFTMEKAEAAKARLREKISGLKSGIDPTAILDLTEIGGAYFEGGIRDFPEWSSNLINEFGEKIKPYLDEVWARVNAKLKEDEFLRIGEKLKEIDDKTDMRYVARQLAEWYVEEGIKDRNDLVDKVHAQFLKQEKDISKREVADLISGYGEYKELNKDAVKTKLRDLKGQLQQVSKLEDMEKGKAPLKTGVERRSPSDEERRLIKQVEEYKKKYNIQTTDPAKQLRSALDALKTRLKNQIKDLEIQISTKEKIVKEKRSVVLDEEAKALKAKKDVLKAQFDEIFEKPGMSDEKRLELALDRTKKSIAEYERRIIEKDYSLMNKPKTPLENKELEKLRTKRESLRKQYKTLKDLLKPKKSPEEIALQSLKTRMKTNIERLETRSKKLDFESKERKSVILDEEGRRLKQRYDSLRTAYQDAKSAKDLINEKEMNQIISLAQDASLKKEYIKDTSPNQSNERLEYGRALVKYIDYVSDLKNKSKKQTLEGFKAHPIKETIKSISKAGGITKSFKSAYDNSVILRQGLKTLITHPEIWFKNAKQTFVDIANTFGGKETLNEIRADIYSRKNALNGLYKKEKLAVGVNEESYPESLPEKIPVVGKAFKASEAAFVGFLYRTRSDVFDKLVEIAQKSKADIEGIGLIVNSLTGRGTFGEKTERGASLVNNIFFSPRYIKSNFDILTGQVTNYENMSRFARKQAALNTLKVVGGLAGALSLINAISPDSIEKDPRSSKFGKIKIGNRWYDFSGGAASLVTLASRLIMNSTKSGRTNKVYKLGTGKFGSQDRMDVIYDFFEGKLSPVFAVIRDLAKGKTYEGKKPTISSTLSGLVTPLPITNAYESFKESNSADALLSIIADIVGISSTEYKKRK